MTQGFAIGRSRLGPDQPVFVVAELSANHNQSFDMASQLVHAAKEAGANAVKLQTYTADTLTIDCDSERFRIGAGSLWEGRTLYDLYQEAHTPWEWQPRLKAIADELGMPLFSTPFDPTAVDFLEDMGVPAYKVASFELVDIPLIRLIAATGKPMIMSTGMATLGEIEEAVSAARGAGATEIALLKCTSAYPAPPESTNLRTIRHLGEAFGVPVGLSDHTLGIAVPVAAVAVGACMVEKHFTLSRCYPGPDSAFSLEPAEFSQMVEAIRVAELAVGSVEYGAGGAQRASGAFRRSLYAVNDIAAGEELTKGNVRSIRPGGGLPPALLSEIVGCKAVRDIARGTPLSWGDILPMRPDSQSVEG